MVFQIVKIVNEYMVVVNYGLKDNARINDELEIYSVGERVLHPKTNEDLGTLDVKKANVKVINVYENMSLCKTTETIRINDDNFHNSFGKVLSALSEKVGGSYEVKPLLVNTEQISGGYDTSDLTINLMDPVKIIKSQYLTELEEEIDEE